MYMLHISGDTSMSGGFFTGTPSQTATGEKKV